MRSQVRQPAFWAVHAGIVAVTLFHYATELRIGQPPFDELHHLPVMLYVFPIMYASLRFGRQGGLWAGAWSAVLCIPNFFAFHQHWASASVELAQVLANLVVGVVLSAVVGNERTLRRDAEGLTERLRGVNGLIIQAQEDERLRISRELHDESIQHLIHLCQQLDVVMAHPALSGPAHDELAMVRAGAEATADGLRRFSRDLRPSVIDDLGLVPALESLALDVGQRTPTRISLNIVGEPTRLNGAIELACFRIAQEALRNVERHARAAAAVITLEFAPRMLRLSVEDDGDGFAHPASLDALVASGHLGLAGLFERARLIGATLELHTAPGDGTVVMIEVSP